MKKSVLFLASLAAALGGTALANVTQPSIFGNNMVLQRDVKVPVWGWADQGEEVTVTFNGQTKKAVAGADGSWQVTLDPMKFGGPFQMSVKGKNELKYSNVAIGEVWICSGQSNMEWRTSSVNNAGTEIKNANYPNIRLFYGNTYKGSMALQKDIPGRKWEVCGPKTVGRFSAVGYFFGRDIYKALNIPVGLISVNWGGTRIEPWTSTYGFSTQPSLKGVYNQLQANVAGTPKNIELSKKAIADVEKWLVEAKKAIDAKQRMPDLPDFPNGIRYYNQGQPTVLFNNMVAPLTKYAFRGMLWYQGEANLGDGAAYTDKMKALAASWRKEFNNPEMPLYFVQLAPFNYGNPERLPMFWEAQQAYADQDKLAGMAVINDIGNFRDIHPRNKQDVGYRLALLALKHTYGKTDLVADSPFFESLKADGSKLVVTFRNAKTLKTRDGKPSPYFEIAGLDGKYFPATVVLDGNKAVLSSDKVAQPYMARYAWNHNVTTTLVNENNLPAGAFRASLPIPVRGQLDANVPEAKNFQVLYAIDAKKAWMNNAPSYLQDNAKKFTGKKIKKLGYFMYLSANNGRTSYVFVTMDPFTQEIGKLGLPAARTKAFFQQTVKNLFVKSNVDGLKTGSFADGNIEFWGSNYGPQNHANVPGAANDKYDFGDGGASPNSDGYGSMQIHNYKEKQVVFAFNNFRSGSNADIGIGTNRSGHPDYTFTQSMKNYSMALILVLAELE